MTGAVTLERFRAIFVLVAAWPLFFGHALAQEQEQEPPAQQDAGSESAAGNTPANDASDEGGTGAEEKDDGAAGGESAPAADPGIDPAFDPDVYDPELDDQTYEGDDDIFVPTEEIPADEPIPFPSDI